MKHGPVCVALNSLNIWEGLERQGLRLAQNECLRERITFRQMIFRSWPHTVRRHRACTLQKNLTCVALTSVGASLPKHFSCCEAVRSLSCLHSVATCTNPNTNPDHICWKGRRIADQHLLRSCHIWSLLACQQPPCQPTTAPFTQTWLTWPNCTRFTCYLGQS